MLILQFFCWTTGVFVLCCLFGFSFGLRELYLAILKRVLKSASELQVQNPWEQDCIMMRAAAFTEKSSPRLEEENLEDLKKQSTIRRVNSKASLLLPAEEDAEKKVEGEGEGEQKRFDKKDGKRRFHMADVFHFIYDGLEAMVDDEVTKCFSHQERRKWNLLTRTHEESDTGSSSKTLNVLWAVGFAIRYLLLLPFRMTFGLIGIFFFLISFTLIAQLPQSQFRKAVERGCSFFVARMFVLSWSAIIRYHNVKNRPQSGICVANHTSPIDCIILANDNCYSLVGQRHTGFIGLLQKTLSIAQTHLWFERSEASDRSIVLERMQEHVRVKDSNPILIFPEGTCVNNTSVMMFKKGSFEISAPIYPVAIKYDPDFADCFWDSRRQGFVTHILSLLTTWAVVADVWYLPPVHQLEGESSCDFANRVKALIAKKSGLADLPWDGMLKRSKLKPQLMNVLQNQFASKLLVNYD